MTSTILNFGSLNIDLVYRTPHFVLPGETLACRDFHRFAGGKGLNQSVALARAGARVRHAGKIGADGDFLIQTLRDAGVDTDLILKGDTPTGHAVIEVDDAGHNRILLYPGANRTFDRADLLRLLDASEPNSLLLLQNEINDVPFLMNEAKKRGFSIALNPSPCTEDICGWPLETLDFLFVNELEGAMLAGLSPESDQEKTAEILAARLPEGALVMTLGAAGALYAKGAKRIRIPAEKVRAVDTTGAGDTFTGYFLAALQRGLPAETAMRMAGKAAGIAVGRPGAAASIPFANEVFTS